MRYFRAPKGLTPNDPNPFGANRTYGREWIALSFTPTEDCYYGVTGCELFLIRMSLKWCDPRSVVADFVRYQTSQGLKPVLFLTDEHNSDAFIAAAILSTPPPHVIRDTDPEIQVHSTSLEAGREILRDGAIKSRALLLKEGRNLDWQELRSSDLGEPESYADLIQSTLIDSALGEAVMASHMQGRNVAEDEPYEPGFRFYVDVHEVIKSGLDTRFSGGIVVRERLPLRPFVTETLSLLDVDPERTTRVWTPKSFTAAANEMFRQRRRRGDCRSSG